MRQVVFLAVAGALGTLSRYGLGELVHRVVGQGFPYGTLAVNMLGCFAIGFVVTLFSGMANFPKEAHLVATVGFLGAFTTFSAFSYDSFRLLSDGNWGSGLTNILLNVVLGLVAVVGGVVLARVVR